MSATNTTTNYHLPIFLGTDVPSWLTDWNSAMSDIDIAIAAAKTTADAAQLTASNAQNAAATNAGAISTLQTTVAGQGNSITTLTGSVNTINSLIGNGLPTTTDQTIIGAINELHANQGDLLNLTTTDKSSLVAAINEAAQSGGSTPTAAQVSYDNTGSGLSATDVQDAIDEIVTNNNVRYNNVAHTLEALVGGTWQTIFSNIYPGEYKAAIVYGTTNTSVKILFIRVGITAGTVSYIATDSTATYNSGDIIAETGYGLVNAAFTISNADLHIGVSNGAKYIVLDQASASDNASIIAAALPQNTSSMSTGTGAQVHSNMSDSGHVGLVTVVA